MATIKMPVSVLAEIFAAISNDVNARKKAAETMCWIDLRLGLDLGTVILCIEDDDVRRWALNEINVYKTEDKGEI